MRKLKLQMQITIDGFVADPKGELDWMELESDELRQHTISLTDAYDTILMGRKMSEGFITYWSDAVKKPEHPWYELAKRMIDYPKIVFTKTLDKSPWPNVTLAKGDLIDEVNRLKSQEGKDIVAYGGATFASSLIKNNLIDEYHLFVNPVAIGEGMTIFKGLGRRVGLKQLEAIPLACGVTIHKFIPAQAKAARSA